MTAGAEAVITLHASMAGRFEAAGARQDRRTLQPHLTLARWRYPSGSVRLKATDGTRRVATVEVAGVTLYEVGYPPPGPPTSGWRTPVFKDSSVGRVLTNMPVLAVIAAYAIGSVPFALILARRWGVADLRRFGSGNLGAANVLRRLGRHRRRARGAARHRRRARPASVSPQRLERRRRGAGAAGLAAVVGHVYPVWLGSAAARASPRRAACLRC